MANTQEFPVVGQQGEIGCEELNGLKVGVGSEKIAVDTISVADPPPFTTFTWEDWLGVEVQTRNSLHDFLEAMEQGQTNSALAAALDLQEVVTNLLEEIYARAVFDGLEPLPSSGLPGKPVVLDAPL